jgi:hypothetical protein
LGTDAAADLALLIGGTGSDDGTLSLNEVYFGKPDLNGNVAYTRCSSF